MKRSDLDIIIHCRLEIMDNCRKMYMLLFGFAMGKSPLRFKFSVRVQKKNARL